MSFHPNSAEAQTQPGAAVSGAPGSVTRAGTAASRRVSPWCPVPQSFAGGSRRFLPLVTLTCESKQPEREILPRPRPGSFRTTSKGDGADVRGTFPIYGVILESGTHASVHLDMFSAVGVVFVPVRCSPHSRCPSGPRQHTRAFLCRPAVLACVPSLSAPPCHQLGVECASRSATPVPPASKSLTSSKIRRFKK